MVSEASEEAGEDCRRVWGTMLFLAAGYALCRACAELPMGLAGFDVSWEEAGKLSGLLAILLYLVVGSRIAMPRVAENLPELCLAGGSVLGVACYLMQNEVLGGPAGFLMGLGASMSMMLWLEAFGMLPSRRIVVCLSLAYMLEVPVGVLSMALAGTAAVPALMCTATIAAILMRRARLSDQGTYNMVVSFPRRVNGLDTLVPGVVAAWVLASGTSFGIMEAGSLGSVAGSMLDVVGRCVPCVLVVAGYLFASERFDLRWLYGITLPLLLAGLSLAGSSGSDSGGAALLFCMGASAARLVAYFAVCSVAAARGVSSLFGCTCVMLLNVVARNLGVFLSSTPVFAAFNGAFFTVAVVVTSATVVIFLMVELGEKNPGKSSEASESAQGERAESRVERLACIASGKGLSPREADVFLCVMAGKTTAGIADELFISAGAVRSHTSRIYEKFGVHSRQELERAVQGL